MKGYRPSGVVWTLFALALAYLIFEIVYIAMIPDPQWFK